MNTDKPEVQKSAADTASRSMMRKIVRWLLLVIGCLSVAAGVIGLFLPLVPTVPLLLLAAACFARSSERFHRWLVEHDHLGPFIRDYLQGTGIPTRVKATAIGMVWISVPVSAFVFVKIWWVRVVLLLIAAGITLYLLQLPTQRGRDEKP